MPQADALDSGTPVRHNQKLDGNRMKKLIPAAILAATASFQAQAFKFDAPEGWEIRWDNTFKGNLMYRVENQDPSVYSPERADPSTTANVADDANYSVDEDDWVSQRIDVLSEVDVIWQDQLGFRVSGAAWYDHGYSGGSDHPSSGPTKGFDFADSTWGSLSAQPGDWTDKAKDLHYKDAEVLDAFLFANFDIGDTAGNLRIGRHTLYWGQSALVAGALHGFAGSMATIDFSKGLGAPGTEVKELFIPNGKVSSTLQFTSNLSVSGYYAYDFEPVRWPETGTYFATNEVASKDGEFVTAVPRVAVGFPSTARLGYIQSSQTYKDSGDWGLNLSYYVERWDLETSLIYMNNTDRMTNGLYGTTDVSVSDADRALAAQTSASPLGYFSWVFKKDIKTMGISLSKQIWDISWGADLVYRDDNAIYLDTSSSIARGLSHIGAVGPGSDYPGATGDTVHIVLNGVGFFSPDWGLWDGGTYLVEVTASNLLDFNDNEEFANVFIKEDKWCSTVAFRASPTWYQVRPGWDLSAPSSFSMGTSCRQATTAGGGNQDIGNGSLGLAVDIDQAWNIALKYNIFFGPQSNGPAAYIKDRDNVSLTVKRTF
jgi:hypothetical protein